MSGTGQAWRLWALLPPEIRIDQLETMQPNPHTRTILGETGTGAVPPVEGNRGAMATPGKPWGSPTSLLREQLPTPGWGQGRLRLPHFPRKEV